METKKKNCHFYKTVDCIVKFEIFYDVNKLSISLATLLNTRLVDKIYNY